MPSLVVDLDPPIPDAPGFRGDQSDLVYFLSLAYAARFGAQHDLSLAALTLQTDFGISLKPLLTFAAREVEEPEDAESLDSAWQDARVLAECCEKVVEILDSSDRRFRKVLVDYPALRDRLDELGQIARWASEQDARIRVTYLMSGGT